MRWFRNLAIGVLALVVLAVVAYCTPYPLFAHHYAHGRFDLWSDRAIDEAGAARVLDDAQRRITRSALDDGRQRFRVFVCNDNWKLALYSGRGQGGMGGATDVYLTRNIYLREADLSTNRLVPAHPGRAPMGDRPLSYYIAHEATHVLESRALGRLMSLRYPTWMREGYADYVGKAGQFDVEANLAALKAGDRSMDPRASGLYRRYQLAVAYELDAEHVSVRQMFDSRAPEDQVLARLRADPNFGR